MDNSPERYFSDSHDAKPGRPTPSNDTLERDRDDLALLLSVNWPDIGWQLRHANTVEEIQRAFEPLRGKNNDRLILRFLTVAPIRATGKDVRLTKKLLKKAIMRRYAAQRICGNPQRDCCEAEIAVMQAGGDQTGKVRAELLKRQSRLLAVRKELHSATELEQELEKQLAEQEVSFCQNELLRILRERRCARNPLRLANAIAGLPSLIAALPSLTARVSYERCSKIKCRHWPKIDFQVFQKIESIWNLRVRYRGLPIVELFRQEIRKLPRTSRRNKSPNLVRLRLADNFGVLKSAIEKTLESGIEPDRVPFVITSYFDKNRETPTTALTRTLAASERID